METKQKDGRVLVSVLFILLAFCMIGLFVARERSKPDSKKPDTIQQNSAAPEVKSPSQKVDRDHPIDFGPYMAALQRRIKRSWFPPKNTESLRGKVIFKVRNDGTLANLRMAKGTGLARADEAMLNAVERAAPFAALPPGAPVDVDIEFTFDYNVFANKDKMPPSENAESESKRQAESKREAESKSNSD